MSVQTKESAAPDKEEEIFEAPSLFRVAKILSTQGFSPAIEAIVENPAVLSDGQLVALQSLAQNAPQADGLAALRAYLRILVDTPSRGNNPSEKMEILDLALTRLETLQGAEKYLAGKEFLDIFANNSDSIANLRFTKVISEALSDPHAKDKLKIVADILLLLTEDRFGLSNHASVPNVSELKDRENATANMANLASTILKGMPDSAAETKLGILDEFFDKPERFQAEAYNSLRDLQLATAYQVINLKGASSAKIGFATFGLIVADCRDRKPEDKTSLSRPSAISRNKSSGERPITRKKPNRRRTAAP